ncbi:hypothetical protein F2Q70_00012388 [Brassica cretica]|uniref:Uncharacterized protein n=1 Tax=Brassica cretica TaxID=69181 RepID=A0A8S9LYS6_BRACR|nr:hypothetical protein F2Q70_00012388 [Brassica cretica]
MCRRRAASQSSTRPGHPRTTKFFSILAIVNASRSSSHDQVLRQTKREDTTVCDSHERSIERPSENNSPTGACDLRSKLKRKSQATESTHNSNSDLRAVIDKSRAKRVESTSVRPHLKLRVVDLRDQLNSRDSTIAGLHYLFTQLSKKP